MTSRWRRSPFFEAALFALGFGLVYGSLGVLLYRRTPRLFMRLDILFDADLPLWTIDLARSQGPHGRARTHPLVVILLNPLGSSLRALLRWAGCDLAGQLAALLLCATAGAVAVGVFRVLLGRLGVAEPRARLWTLLFALSTTQIVFSSVPESYALSALSLIVVFTVAAGPCPTGLTRLAAGVFSFGITVTNLVAVAIARGVGLGRRPRAIATVARHVAAVVLVAAGLSLVQRAVYPTTDLFFTSSELGDGQLKSIVRPVSLRQEAGRVADLGSHLFFVCLAAPRIALWYPSPPIPVVDFPAIPLLSASPASVAHSFLWAVVLVGAVWGWIGRARPQSTGARALLLWLAFEASFHMVYGWSLFLYSAHWAFAVVALTAVGVEWLAVRFPRLAVGILVALVCLQIAANGSLVLQMLEIFSG